MLALALPTGQSMEHTFRRTTACGRVLASRRCTPFHRSTPPRGKTSESGGYMGGERSADH